MLSAHLTYNLYMTMIQKFSLVTWFFTPHLGFTVAYFLVFHVRSQVRDRPVPRLHGAVLDLDIIRMIAWLPLLGKQGLIN